MKLTILIFFVFLYSKVYAFNCAELWTKGFPVDGYKESFPCNEYDSVDIPSGKLRIFYASGISREDVETLMPMIKKAAVDSHLVYGRFDNLPPSTIIYTGLKSPKGFNAEVPFFHAEDYEPRPVLVFTNIKTESLEQQQQTIAHEYFHVFQSSNFAKSWFEKSAAWWVEGSADFFSNLVYPKTNREWANAEAYDSDVPLFSQSSQYSTTAFFQSMSNSWSGTEGVLSLLNNQDKTDSPHSFDGQWKGLSKFTSIDMHFEKFAKEFSLNKIQDTGGGYLNTHFVQPLVKAIPEFDSTQNIEVHSFVVNEYRYKLLMGYRYFVTTHSMDDSNSTFNYLHEGKDKNWQSFYPSYPAVIDLSCKD